jgi:ketose-bisphosphate aldolase
VPIAIHLDHCKNLDFVSKCIEHGWTSVMIDASSFPFEKNMELSEAVVNMAHPKGVSVEAELGEIGGVEDDLVVAEEDAHLADPEKVFEFLERVPVDCFAPAIGTAHGVYKGEPRVAFDRLKIISEANGTPLALHGGTGLTDDVFKKCISLGCAKVNISTELKHNFIDGFVNYHTENPTQYDPLKVLGAQYEQMTAMVKKYIELFKISSN